MKRFFFIVLAIGAAGLVANAQNSFTAATGGVPESVSNAFQSQFAASQVQWITGEQEIEAQFKKDGVASFAFYSLQGQYLGLEQESKMETFPAQATTFLSNSFLDSGHYTLLSARSRTESEPNQNLYVALMQHNQNNSKIKLFFDTEGKLIRRQLFQ